MKRLVIVFLLFMAGSAAAAEPARQGFWGAVDVGYGRLDLRPDTAPKRSDTRFYFGLAGGYTILPQLQLGIEASSWNIESSSLWEPYKGQGLMQLFAVARYRPTPDARLFVKVGAGTVSHWDNAAGASDGHGAGYCVGLGYEMMRFGGAATYWFINYNAGRVSGYRPPGGVSQSEAYSAVTAGLSFGF